MSEQKPNLCYFDDSLDSIEMMLQSVRFSVDHAREKGRRFNTEEAALALQEARDKLIVLSTNIGIALDTLDALDESIGDFVSDVCKPYKEIQEEMNL